MFDRLLEWDRETLIFLNNLGVERFDAFWETITKYPPWIPLFIIFFVLIFRAVHWRQALGILVVLSTMILFVETLTNLTKLVVERLRPNNDDEIRMFIRVLRNPSSYSFYSGHACMSFSITTFVYFFVRKRFRWTYLFYIWPFLFIMSRIYLGVHYPSDVIVGALVGVLSAWIYYKLYTNLILPYLTLSHP